MNRRTRKKRRRRRKHRGGGFFGALKKWGKDKVTRGWAATKTAFTRKKKIDCSEDLKKLSEKIHLIIKDHLKEIVPVEKAQEVVKELSEAIDDTKEQFNKQEGEADVGEIGGEDTGETEEGGEDVDEEEAAAPQVGGKRGKRTKRRKKRRRKRTKRR